MIKEFKAFVLRGNVVDLAVAVVVGAAFGAIVKAFVTDLVTPLIAAAGGQPNFAGLSFTVNHSQFLYGDFINSVLAFLIVAAVMFFFVVVPLNRLQRPKGTEAPDTIECRECLTPIPVNARRCSACGQPQAA